LVAASGETAGLSSKTAITWFAAVLAGLALVAFFSIRNNSLDKMGLDQSPKSSHKSPRDYCTTGIRQTSGRQRFGIYNNNDVVQYIEKTKNRIQTGTAFCREVVAHSVLVPAKPSIYGTQRFSRSHADARHHRSLGPALIVSGMVRVELDPQGRLIYFEAIPRS
jgi:hypothetical protein